MKILKETTSDTKKRLVIIKTDYQINTSKIANLLGSTYKVTGPRIGHVSDIFIIETDNDKCKLYTDLNCMNDIIKGRIVENLYTKAYLESYDLQVIKRLAELLDTV